MSREMKDSGVEWIGEIPETWQVLAVKRYFNISRGRVISAFDLVNNGKYPVYSSQTDKDGCFGYLDTYDYSGPAITWTTDGAKADVSPIARKVNIIKIDETGISIKRSPERSYCS